MSELLTQAEGVCREALAGALESPRPIAQAPVHDLAATACRSACRSAGLAGAVLVVADGESRRPIVAGAYGSVTSVLAHRRLDAEVAHAVGAILDGAEPAAEIPSGRLVLVAVSDGTACLAVLVGVPPATDGPLTLPQLHALQGIADLTATALVRAAQADADGARLTRARVDLARTIHEDVVQRLFGASLVLSADAPLPAEAMELCCSEVQGALRDLRSILGASLQAQATASPGTLAASLRALAAAADVVVVECDGPTGRLEPEQDATARSVLAEAVRNARKHAICPQITVSVRLQPTLLTLTVENDGVCDGERCEPGLGLRLATTEAIHADGLLEHGPTPGGRWRVRLTLPTDRGSA